MSDHYPKYPSLSLTIYYSKRQEQKDFRLTKYKFVARLGGSWPWVKLKGIRGGAAPVSSRVHCGCGLSWTPVALVLPVEAGSDCAEPVDLSDSVGFASTPAQVEPSTGAMAYSGILVG